MQTRRWVCSLVTLVLWRRATLLALATIIAVSCGASSESQASGEEATATTASPTVTTANTATASADSPAIPVEAREPSGPKVRFTEPWPSAFAGHADRKVAGLFTNVPDASALLELNDGRIASGGSDGAILIWDVGAPDEGAAIYDGHYVGEGHTPVQDLIQLEDGRVVSTGLDVQVWDPADVQAGPIETLSSGARTLATASDGRVLVGREDGEVEVWDLSTSPGSLVATYYGHVGTVVRSILEISPGVIASAGDDDVDIWNLDSQELLAELQEPEQRIVGVDLLPDGRLVALDSYSRVWTWDLSSPSPPVIPSGFPSYVHDGYHLLVLADGRVALGGSGGVYVLDPTTGDEEFHLRPQTRNQISSVIQLSDGNLLTAEDEVWIWPSS